jgi:trans-4-hydroxy-L-proline dehydratase
MNMLPQRIKKSMEQWFDKDYRSTFYERIDYLMESEPLYRELPYSVRYGKTLEYTLDRITVLIQPEEKIVGSVKEIIPTEEQKEFAESLSKEWWDIPLEEIQQKILWFYSYGWLKRRPTWFYSFGHLALVWEDILNKGLGELRDYAKNKLSDKELTSDLNKKNFLEGSVICYDALIKYINRYAEVAAEDAQNSNDPLRKDELLKISESCSHISDKPARNFKEALQLMWLVILPLMKVCGCGVLNLSRMDQYLYPFYKNDLEKGILTREEALELIEEFYNKNNDIMIPTDHMSQEIQETQYTVEVTYDDPNYLILGGLLKGNEPGVNELSYLFIEAAHEMKLRNPFIVVRYYSGIDEKFWLKVCDAIRDNATIVVYNDETMIPALVSYGVDKEDVYDYGFYGCNDPVIPGKEGGLRQLWFNLVRPFELALNQGEYPMKPGRDSRGSETQYSIEDRMIGLMTGPFYGIETKPLEEIKNIDDLLEVYKQQLRYLVEDYRKAFEKDFEGELKWNAGRIRIEDCFLEGTIDNATTWNNGGTKYHKITFQGGGVGTVVDCLAAIEELVFKNKEMSLKELVEILNNNFENQELLQMRLRKRMPKFGNDTEWVDELAAKVVNIFCDEVQRVNGEEYVYQFFPCLSTDRDFTGMGKYIGATPDGRYAGQQISENQSPTEGSDISGITALFNSVSKIPFNRITGGPLNIRIHPSAVKGENGLKVFASVMRTFFEKGGLQTQINVVSKHQLLDAQNNPDKYKDLCVRVTGYSAYFVQMGKKAQDELINRSEKI